jgi:tRNA 2-thiocytidine biosynthesis protein TtcA
MSDKLAYYLLKKVNKANRDHDLFADGDRVAVAVSGGKDSLSLLRLLRVRQRSARERYTVVAIHVVPAADAPCGTGGDTSALEAWFEGEGVEYAFVPMEEASGQPDRESQSPCFHCAWRRRKAVFLAAERLACNKVALGHHADDIAQTTLLNLFFQGRLETMRPRVEFFDGQLTVVRPLAYVPEKELVRFAAACDFPPASAPCVAAGTSRRALMAQVLRAVEETYPKVKINLWRAVERAQTWSRPQRNI